MSTIVVVRRQRVNDNKNRSKICYQAQCKILQKKTLESLTKLCWKGRSINQHYESMYILTEYNTMHFISPVNSLNEELPCTKSRLKMWQHMSCVTMFFIPEALTDDIYFVP
jgi:hypothetical protein